jgi:hypothetical protein
MNSSTEKKKEKSSMPTVRVIEVYLNFEQLRYILNKQRLIVRDPQIHTSVGISALDGDIDKLFKEIQEGRITNWTGEKKNGDIL